MATKKLSKSEIKKGKCSYPDPPDEGLPIWMGTFADMMTLLFAFFVLLFSMATIDPAKVDRTFGDMDPSGTSVQSQAQIMESLDSIIEKTSKDIKEALKEDIEKSDISDQEKTKALEELEVKDPLKVMSSPDGVAIEIDGDICFSSGSIELKKEIKLLLDKVAKLMLNPKDNRRIFVQGHTDNVPLVGNLKERFENNFGLSTYRAVQVVTYLIEEHNVPKKRLIPEGYAGQWPADATWIQNINGEINEEFIAKSNKSPEQKAKNRRIKIVFASI